MAWKSLLLVGMLFTATAARAQSSNPVLDQYVLELGAPGQENQSPGVELQLSDRFFGGGFAQARIGLIEHSSSSTLWERPMLLFLEVERKAARDEISLSLDVISIDVQGFNATGQLIYAKTLKGFNFPESESGKWHERLASLPTGLSALTITFYGNYR